jgi:hypothetical protein
VSWFLRAIEQTDGQWICRFGIQDFGTMPDETSALLQLATAATALGGRELFHFYLHRHDGSVESRRGTDPVFGE